MEPSTIINSIQEKYTLESTHSDYKEYQIDYDRSVTQMRRFSIVREHESLTVEGILQHSTGMGNSRIFLEIEVNKQTGQKDSFVKNEGKHTMPEDLTDRFKDFPDHIKKLLSYTHSQQNV